MPRKIDLSLLEHMLDGGENFELSPSDYEKVLGRTMPETDNYLKYDSPVAKKAKSMGYTLQIKDKIKVERTLVFVKNK